VKALEIKGFALYQNHNYYLSQMSVADIFLEGLLSARGVYELWAV
jgi:hypothetical protein